MVLVTHSFIQFEIALDFLTKMISQCICASCCMLASWCKDLAFEQLPEKIETFSAVLSILSNSSGKELYELILKYYFNSDCLFRFRHVSPVIILNIFSASSWQIVKFIIGYHAIRRCFSHSTVLVYLLLNLRKFKAHSFIIFTIFLKQYENTKPLPFDLETRPLYTNFVG